MEHLAIDLGARKSQICVRNAKGDILAETRWPTEALAQYLKARPPSRVILETSSEAFAVADMAKEFGHEVRVVPALLVKSLGVGARGIKNDKRDARATSEASCRADLPSVHIPSMPSRDLRATCTSREALITARTKLVNTVRSFMRTQLVTMAKGTPATFPKRARERLLQTECGIPGHVEQLLKVIDCLNEQVAIADKEMAARASAHPICKQMMTVPGVGPVTSARFVAAVDDAGRFTSAHQLQSYFGLTPGENVTGFQGHRTHLTKAGSARMRWTLVQACWSAIRCRPGDPMVAWALKIAERRGRGVAVVALARKVAGILYAMWRDGTTYDPRRGAQILETDGRNGPSTATIGESSGASRVRSLREPTPSPLTRPPASPETAVTRG